MDRMHAPAGKNDPVKYFIEALNKRAEIEIILGDIASAERDLHDAMKYTRKARIMEMFYSALLTLSNIYEMRGEYDRYRAVTERALKGCRKIEYNDGLAHAISNKAIMSGNAGNISRAIELYREALAIYRKEKAPEKAAVILINISTNYMFSGDLKNMKAYAVKAMLDAEKSGNMIIKAMALEATGLFYKKNKDPATGLRFFFEALAIREKINDAESMAMGCHQIGHTYLVMKKYGKALEYLNRALDICLSLGNLQGLSAIFHNLGEVFRRMGKHDKAVYYYRKTIEIDLKLGNPQRSVGHMMELCDLLLIIKEPGDAMKVAEKALKLSLKNTKDLIDTIRDKISQIKNYSSK